MRPIRHHLVAQRQCTPVAGRQVLDGVKTEATQVTDRAAPSALVLGTARVRRILDDRYAPSNPLEAVHVDGTPP